MWSAKRANTRRMRGRQCVLHVQMTKTLPPLLATLQVHVCANQVSQGLVAMVERARRVPVANTRTYLGVPLALRVLPTPLLLPEVWISKNACATLVTLVFKHVWLASQARIRRRLGHKSVSRAPTFRARHTAAAHA